LSKYPGTGDLLHLLRTPGLTRRPDGSNSLDLQGVETQNEVSHVFEHVSRIIQDYQDAAIVYRRAVDRFLGLDAKTAGRLRRR